MPKPAKLGVLPTQVDEDRSAGSLRGDGLGEWLRSDQVRFTRTIPLVLGYTALDHRHWIFAALGITRGRSISVREQADRRGRVLLVGLTSVGFYQALFHLGINWTSASNSSLLAGTSPIWTSIIAVGCSQERIVPLQIVGILLSFVGPTWVITSGSPFAAVSSQSLRGYILPLLATMMSALGVVLAVDLLRRYSTLRVLSWTMASGRLE